ncbi:MAG: zinc ribbon domain-containing protein [Oscillospiraceae bacterium]|nr:zinc ribbon domain-containing protein [Oscillospiraceae bacterium]
MKKLFSLILAVVFVFSLSCNAFAAEYTFDEFGLSYDVPEKWLVATKDTPEDAEIFVDYLYYDETMQYMSELGLCLYAISEDYNTEFTIELSKSDDYVEFSDYSGLQLKQACSQIKETWESYGYENCAVDTYSNDLTTFITVSYDYASGGVRVYGLDYLAYIDGNYTVLCLYSYYDEVTSEEIQTMQGVADSIISTNSVPEEKVSVSSSSVRSISKLLRWVVTVAVAGIGSFIAWIKSKKRKNKNVPDTVPAQPEEIIPEQTENPEPHPEETAAPDENPQKYCTSCGAPVSGDEKFCTVCGNKIK